ncbi:MAG: formate dehydrogenase accessory sulfurtransferase FdhD [Gemmatimonadaceae bacterium]
MTVATIDVLVERMRAAGAPALGHDLLAVEEPLEIRVDADIAGERVRKTISVTMRTPGHDVELAAGFLFTEGIIRDRAEIEHIGQCGAAGNVARVRLSSGTGVDLARLERHFYTTSSCGVCGKTSIEALETTSRYALPTGAPIIEAELVHRLPDALRAAQAIFDRTGGLHASALFDAAGRLHCLREDVGRHNALDKVIGAELLVGRLPAHERILVVSGRASFELVQKAVMAGIPILVAVGAPSSLAVEVAVRTGMTLVGFARDGRFNIYAGKERVRASASGLSASQSDERVIGSVGFPDQAD